jgi:hypothetical protein
MPLLDLQAMRVDDDDDWTKASRLSVTGCHGISHISVTRCRPHDSAQPR